MTSEFIGFPGSGKADLPAKSKKRNLLDVLDQTTTDQGKAEASMVSSKLELEKATVSCESARSVNCEKDIIF